MSCTHRGGKKSNGTLTRLEADTWALLPSYTISSRLFSLLRVYVKYKGRRGALQFIINKVFPVVLEQINRVALSRVHQAVLTSSTKYGSGCGSTPRAYFVLRFSFKGFPTSPPPLGTLRFHARLPKRRRNEGAKFLFRAGPLARPGLGTTSLHALCNGVRHPLFLGDDGVLSAQRCLRSPWDNPQHERPGTPGNCCKGRLDSARM